MGVGTCEIPPFGFSSANSRNTSSNILPRAPSLTPVSFAIHRLIYCNHKAGRVASSDQINGLSLQESIEMRGNLAAGRRAERRKAVFNRRSQKCGNLNSIGCVLKNLTARSDGVNDG